MRTAAVLAVAAGCVMSFDSAFAQSEPVALREEVKEVYPVGYPPTSYAGRDVGTVYNNGGESNTSTQTQTQSVCSWGDEIDFAGGPWATVTTRLATQLTVWIQSSGTACPEPSTQAYDVLVDFWADADHDYTANPMMTGTPLGSFRIAVVGTCGVQTAWNVNLTGLPGGGLLIPSDKVFVQYRIVETGTTTLRPHAAAGTGTQSQFPVFGIGTTLVGQSTPSYFRDVNANQLAVGGTPIIVGTTTTGHEHRTTSSTLNRNQRGRLRGDIPPPPIPTNTPLGTIPDTGLVVNTTLASGEVKWYEATLAAAANDALLQFADIDTEGSGIANVSLGLYLPNGTRLVFDHDDGSVNNAQLSAGVGRRGAVGNGLQYDGRDGQLAAGTYYLAVASGNATFADGFTVTGVGADAGDVQLNIATNTNGTPLAASVEPIINGVDYGTLDPVAGTSAPGLAQGAGSQLVLWSKFTLASAVDATHFMDVDFNRLSDQAADGVCHIFNSAGDIVYMSNNEGPGNLPQMSLGAAGSRTYPPNTVPFDGNTPAGGSAGLAAGTYFMATALGPNQTLSALPSGHRWHLRSTANSSFPIGADIVVGEVAPACGDADYDNDGDSGTDFDIESFFACVGGNCCTACDSPDFDRDGDTGTDFDIESFFRILGGGDC